MTGHAKKIGPIVTCVALAAAAAVTMGTPLVDSSVAVAAPGPASSQRMGEYFMRVGPAYQAMEGPLPQFESAIAASDWTALSSACSGVRSAAGMFEDLLPTPSSRATIRMRGVADSLNSAADECGTWGPTTPPNFAAMMSYVDQARTDLGEAKDILVPAWD